MCVEYVGRERLNAEESVVCMSGIVEVSGVLAAVLVVVASRSAPARAKLRVEDCGLINCRGQDFDRVELVVHVVHADGKKVSGRGASTFPTRQIHAHRHRSPPTGGQIAGEVRSDASDSCKV